MTLRCARVGLRPIIRLCSVVINSSSIVFFTLFMVLKVDLGLKGCCVCFVDVGFWWVK